MSDIPQTKPELIEALEAAHQEIQMYMDNIEQLHGVIGAAQRALVSNRVGFGILGLGVGAVGGFFLTRRLLQTKYSKIADDEIAEMRQHYQAKLRAAESEAQKRPVEDIVRERGYSSPDTATDIKPPMAVQPPADVKEEAEEDEDKPEPEVKNIFREVPPVDFEWDWHKERSQRSPDIPYVVHYDERLEMEYNDVTLTYYEGDDVLCDERDNPIDPDDRDGLIGEGNLERFGHGSNDPVVVYIRNDKLEILYEVVKSPHHFAEEVHGFSHHAYDHGNLERMRARERDDPEA